MTESNFKKSVLTSFRLRHRSYVTEKVTKLRSHDFSILVATPVLVIS